MDSRQDLLLVLLALKANLLDPEGFAALARLWQPSQDGPLFDRLGNAGLLEEADKFHLEYLLDRNMQRHQGDPSAALASLADGPTRQFLAGVRNPAFQEEVQRAFPGPVWSGDAEPGSSRWAKLAGVAAILLGLAGVVGVVAMLFGGVILTSTRREEMAAREMAMVAMEREAAARAQVEDQKARAERDQKLAQKAVDDIVAQLEKSSESKVAQNRRQMLELSLKGYQRILEEKGSKPESQLEVINALQRMAAIQIMLGRKTEAEQAYRQALALAEKAAIDKPADSAVRHQLARCRLGLARFFNEMARPAEAEESIRQATAMLEKLVADFPKDGEYRLSLAETQGALGQMQQEAGKSAEAEQSYRGSLAMLEVLVTASPANGSYRAELGRAYERLGLLLKKTGRGEEAEGFLSKARALEK